MPPKKSVLLSGPTVTDEKELVKGLLRTFEALVNADNAKIEALLRKSQIDLILLEGRGNVGEDLDIITRIRKLYPHIAIVFLAGDGDRALIARAFEFGVLDSFRKPYRCELILARIQALLEQQSRRSERDL